MSKTKDKQLEIIERLKLATLEDFERLLESGEMTAADRAVLVRLLKESGWDLDPAKADDQLKGKLVTKVDPLQLDEDDPDVPSVN